MFRLWAKIFKDNHLLKDTVICDDSNDVADILFIWSKEYQGDNFNNLNIKEFIDKRN